MKRSPCIFLAALAAFLASCPPSVSAARFTLPSFSARLGTSALATSSSAGGSEIPLVAEPSFGAASDPPRRSFNAFRRMPGHDRREDVSRPRPHEYVNADKLPKHFVWSNVAGVNYLTKNLNQHVPQYCGSCWAHGAMSALADRIKIANGPNANTPDVNLAIQFILNCGAEVAGSCHGGSATGAYQFVKDSGFVPFDTCLTYEACSAESSEGSCSAGDTSRYECTPRNTCRTCSTFSDMGGFCSEVDEFPNATIGEYGEVAGEKAIMAEVYARGPVAAGIDANPLDQYVGGVITDTPAYEINHIVSIVGWGETKKGVKYWVVRNSWGEYWGEMGYFRIARGVKALGIEDECSWATPASWTHVNVPCYEDGSNCAPARKKYVDPSEGAQPYGEILSARV